MAHIVMAYVVMAYVVIACIVMAYVVMAYVVMAYVVMAYVVVGCVVMPLRFLAMSSFTRTSSRNTRLSKSIFNHIERIYFRRRCLP